MNKFKVIDYDIIYLSYDEPNAEKNYADLLTKVPWAKRVHGVEGSDAAHKACASLSTTDRFITVDGDNTINDRFLNQELEFKDGVDLSKHVISWTGSNIINGLMYGNGGIKCWDKQTVLDMRTHENADPNNIQAQVDFCWDLEYIQINDCMSTVHNNATAHQAWRAGFREGVKMSLINGGRASLDDFKKVHWKNLHRLYIWTMVGADVENGLWAIYGAREGLYKTMCTEWDYVQVRDFKYLNSLWDDKYNKITEEMLPYEIMGLGETLIHELDIPIGCNPLDAQQSKFFKTVYENPARTPHIYLKGTSEVVKSDIYDIVMITYDEVNAEENFAKLKNKFPRAKRIDKVKGIHQAHIAAAEICTSEMMWVVDGDAEVIDTFNFDYVVENNNKDAVHVWRSKNPINDLEYGYGGIKLLPTRLTKEMDTSKADMTTSISNKFKKMDQISNITAFNSDPFSTWRSAFRECCKLSSKTIDRQKTTETNERLEIWCSNIGKDRQFGDFAHRGAVAGYKYGNENQNNIEALKQINDFNWLKSQFDAENKIDNINVDQPIIVTTATTNTNQSTDTDIIDLLDRFELLYGEDISNLRRMYNDKDLSSIFKLANNEDLRKAVIEQNLHSIFRLLPDEYDELRKAVIEQNLHSIFRLAEADEDLRKAVIEQNLHSIFRLLPDEYDELRKAVLDNNLHSIFRLAEADEDLRKAVLDKNLHSLRRLLPEILDEFKLYNNDKSALWKVLDKHTNSSFVKPLKTLYESNITFDKDCFSRGQILSKTWLTNTLKELDLDLGIVYLCAGWYATVIPMFVENKIKFTAIRSFDIDPTVWSIAEIFNKSSLLDGWKFKAQTKDIMDIDYRSHIYNTIKSNGNIEQLKDSPNTIINTSCEHVSNFTDWYNKIPSDKLVILQTNNYFEIDDHVNCSVDLDDFSRQTPMNRVLYEGELPLEKYTRFMKIGYK